MSEFIAGCSNGIIQSIIGHPLDTVKVLQQTKRPFYRNPLLYYKGITYPTAFNLLCTGAVFDMNDRFRCSWHCNYISGLLTGALVAPVIFMFDIGKIHHQTKTNTPLSLVHFKNMNGITATVIRESFSTAVYMGLYFDMEERYGPLISGGSAGLASWTLTYPFDVIKTRQMNNKKITFKKAFEMGHLWKGFSACAVRAVLVNAAGFWSYNKVKNIVF